MRIVVHPNGPYRVLGGVPLAVQTITPNSKGESWEWTQGRTFPIEAEYFLCRCGQSQNEPFCDNSHLTAGFEGQERLPDAPSTANPSISMVRPVVERRRELLCVRPVL